VSRKIGITEEQLCDLPRFENSAPFSDEEKLVLRLAVSLTRTPTDVCKELYGELRKRFSERGLVELMRLFAGRITERDLIARLPSNLRGFRKVCFVPCQRDDLGTASSQLAQARYFGISNDRAIHSW
jgi:hypothetical protein